MKNILTILIIITSVISLSAQDINYDVKSTEVIRDKLLKRSVGLKAIGSINDRAYILYQPYSAVFSGANVVGKERYYLGMLDQEVNVVKKVELNLDQNGKNVDFEGIQIIKGKMLFFFSFQNEAKKMHYLFARSINPETLELEDDTKMIADLDYSGIGKYKETSVQYEMSDDESKIMFFYTALSRKAEPLRFSVLVYDNQMNLKWRRKVFPKFEKGIFSYKQFRVDNNGDVYLLGAHYADKKNYYESANFKKGFFSSDTYFTDVPNFTFQLYKFSNDGAKEEFGGIDLASKFVRSMNFTAIDGKVLVSGIYSNPETISARGAFSFYYDVASHKNIAESTTEFSTEMIEKGFSDRELKHFKRSIDDKSEYDPFDYFVSEVKTLSDGSKYYTAEQFIEGTKVERSGNQIVYSTIYLYNDVYVIRLKSDNTIDNVKKVSKRQYALNTTRYNSFIDFEVNGNIFLVYNTMKSKNGLFKNVEIGESYISKVNNDVKTKVYKTPDSYKVPLIMPVTQVDFSNNTVLYGMMSVNFKDYKFEIIEVE